MLTRRTYHQECFFELHRLIRFLNERNIPKEDIINVLKGCNEQGEYYQLIYVVETRIA